MRRIYAAAFRAAGRAAATAAACAIVTVHARTTRRPRPHRGPRPHRRPRRPRAEAVAVVGERIAAVGSADESRARSGPRTRVVDLAGRLLVPGFQDAHVHPISGGMDRCSATSARRGPRGVLATIRPTPRPTRTDEWIVGSGWYMADFPNGTPRREDLDAIVPDRPAFLPNRDGHSAWVNSRALELAGIDARRRTRPTAGSSATPTARRRGRSTRAPPSSSSGCCRPGPTTNGSAAFRLGQAYLHSLGITAWQDAIVTPGRPRDLPPRGGDGAADGARRGGPVVGARARRRAGRGVRRAVATGSIGRLRANSVKLMLDGVLETFTGAMLDPYLDADGAPDDEPRHRFIDPSRCAST